MHASGALEKSLVGLSNSYNQSDLPARVIIAECIHDQPRSRHVLNGLYLWSTVRGIGKKFFGGFPKGGSKTAGGLEGTAPQTLKGISHFYTTFVVLLS